MRIRLATADDLPGLCVLYEEFYRSGAEQQPQYYLPATCDGVYPSQSITGPMDDILVAADGGTLAGFAHVQQGKTPPYACVKPYDYAMLVDLVAAPGYRRQGVGRALVEAAGDWAKQRGLAYLELNVLPENLPALGLYEKMGFNTTGYTMRLPLCD